jgi:hypothetical protein
MPAGRTRAFRRRERRVQLRHRRVVPGNRIIKGDTATYRRDGAGGRRTELDGDVRRFGVQEPAQRYDGGSGAVQLGLQTPQMAGDHLRPVLWIGARQNRFHLSEGHVEVAEFLDDLRGGDLFGGVVAVAGERIHRGGFQEPGFVVPAQRPHAQTGQRREFSDRQSGAHCRPPPSGPSLAAGDRVNQPIASQRLACR